MITPLEYSIKYHEDLEKLIHKIDQEGDEIDHQYQELSLLLTHLKTNDNNRNIFRRKTYEQVVLITWIYGIPQQDLAI